MTQTHYRTLLWHIKHVWNKSMALHQRFRQLLRPDLVMRTNNLLLLLLLLLMMMITLISYNWINTHFWSLNLWCLGYYCSLSVSTFCCVYPQLSTFRTSWEWIIATMSKIIQTVVCAFLLWEGCNYFKIHVGESFEN